MAASNSDQDLLHDFSPMCKVHRDGRIERLTGLDFSPPSIDPTTGVQSKDVDIAPESNVSARLFLPANADRSKKLPLLVFFHGGAFLIESAFSPRYHRQLNHLVSHANVVAVSVNYRLAPEHPLPTAFHDSWLALKWIASQPTEEGHEDWIKDYADLSRVYLGGDSAGGTIAHNMAIRVGSEKLDGVNIRGIYLNCPFFTGEEPIGIEIGHPTRSMVGKVLQLACPGVTGQDEPWINPGKDPRVSGLGLKKVLVYVAEKDMFKDRGWYYKEVLKKSGWDGEVECIEVAGEDHVFSVFYPESQNSIAMFEKLGAFINHD